MRIVIVNGTLLDTESMTLVGERHLVIEGDTIVEVTDSVPSTEAADRVVDARGRFLMPGFVDAHVHHVITTMDFHRLRRLSATEKALGAARLAEATVLRGFTTVRDTGGDVTRGLVNEPSAQVACAAVLASSRLAVCHVSNRRATVIFVPLTPSPMACCACQVLRPTI